MRIRTLAVLAIAVAATISHAQPITDSFRYQGTLNDMGIPANGMYNFEFTVFDAEVGGAVVPGGTQSVLNVEVVDGLFEVFIDFGVSGLVFDSEDTRWLSLQVSPAGAGTFDLLSPRQRIAPVPLANYALRAAHATTSGTSLQDAYENGNTIIRGDGDGPVEIRSTTDLPARLNLGSENGLEEEGELHMFGPSGNLLLEVIRLEGFNNGPTGGGYLTLSRTDSGDLGIALVGNSAGQESAEVLIYGPGRVMRFSSRLTGDASVSIPIDAINATEILNETGASETETAQLTFLTNVGGKTDTINVVNIICPTDGYVLVLATAEVSVTHVNGTTSSVNFGVSDGPTFMTGNRDVELRIDSAMPSGTNDYPVTVHGMFPATSGVNTFFFLGDKNNVGGSVSVLDRQLSAVFIPTSYGNIARQGADTLPDEFAQVTAPLTQYDISLEREAAIRADIDRQQQENNAMKQQMQEIQEQMQQLLEQRNRGNTP